MPNTGHGPAGSGRLWVTYVNGHPSSAVNATALPSSITWTSESEPPANSSPSNELGTAIGGIVNAPSRVRTLMLFQALVFGS